MIVVAVDDSDGAELAAARARHLADELGEELHAVHVVQVPSTLFAAMGAVPDVVTEYTDLARRAVWDRVGPRLGEATRVDMDGYPPDAVAKYAADNGATLIVVGSRGRGAVASLVLGSTSHRLIHIADRDVYVVKEAA